jgi:hypothetical protein
MVHENNKQLESKIIINTIAIINARFGVYFGKELRTIALALQGNVENFNFAHLRIWKIRENPKKSCKNRKSQLFFCIKPANLTGTTKTIKLLPGCFLNKTTNFRWSVAEAVEIWDTNKHGRENVAVFKNGRRYSIAEWKPARVGSNCGMVTTPSDAVLLTHKRLNNVL